LAASGSFEQVFSWRMKMKDSSEWCIKWNTFLPGTNQLLKYRVRQIKDMKMPLDEEQ